MAIVKNNNITKALSGRVGNLIFRQRNGKTVVYALPRSYPPPTLQQQTRRQLFAKAVLLAKQAISDKKQNAFFKHMARKGQSTYHAALSYFFFFDHTVIVTRKYPGKHNAKNIKPSKPANFCMVQKRRMNPHNNNRSLLSNDVPLSHSFP